MPLFFITAFYC